MSKRDDVEGVEGSVGETPEATGEGDTAAIIGEHVVFEIADGGAGFGPGAGAAPGIGGGAEGEDDGLLGERLSGEAARSRPTRRALT